MKKEIIVAALLIIVSLSLILLLLNRDYWTLENCEKECEHRGFAFASCKWPSEVDGEDVNIGSCFIKQSKHCGNKGQCNCYCSRQIVGGCGTVHPKYIQECCDRWAEDNDFWGEEGDIIEPRCDGYWVVEEGECSWECGIEEEFCGSSTYASCSSSADCKEGGCSGEVCEGRGEKTVTICIAKQCFDNEKYSMNCACVDSKCQWAKLEHFPVG